MTIPSAMRTQVAYELQRVPRGELPQNLYRAAYQQSRLNALGAHPNIGPEPADAHAAALGGWCLSRA